MEADFDGHPEELSLELTGSVDARTSRELRSALHSLIEVPGRLVVLDLHRVTSADVIGLRVIAAASRYASLRGSRIVLRAAPPAVRRLFAVSRLARVVEFEENRRVS